MDCSFIYLAETFKILNESKSSNNKMKTKIKMHVIKPRNKCWIFHRWKTDLDTGYTKYQKCKDCESRRIIQKSEGYQPINWDYINLNE